MRELSTIQKRENLNRVFAVDEQGPGGANHEYLIVSDTGLMQPKEQRIGFQKGPRKEDDSIQGVIDSDLLEIVRDRLKSFQAGPFSSVMMGAMTLTSWAIQAIRTRSECFSRVISIRPTSRASSKS